MKLRALHRIEGQEVIAPGTEFDLEDKAAKRLLDLGAAVKISGTATTAETASSDTKAAAKTAGKVKGK